MSEKHGPVLELEKIARDLRSAVNGNLDAEMPHGFFSVKRKLCPLSSAVHFPSLSESHITGVNPPKTFPSVSKITVRVFG
jgi:hypothetical protein